MGVDVRDFNSPDDQINTFNNATVDVCKVGDQRVMRINAEPGWKWSTCIKPIVGTETCQAGHVGVIAQGTMHVKHDDGTEMEFTEGDTYFLAPGHDAWVVGDSKAVAYGFHGA